jgi:hypothetical protein
VNEFTAAAAENMLPGVLMSRDRKIHPYLCQLADLNRPQLDPNWDRICSTLRHVMLHETCYAYYQQILKLRKEFSTRA